MNSTWYVRREDGTIYGPCSLSELISWAKNGRIGPNDDVSQDQETWKAAPMLNDLEMVWSIQVDENLIFGPFNIYALIEMTAEDHLSYATDTVHLQTGKHHSLGDVLFPLLFAERKSLLQRAREAAAQELADVQSKNESLQAQLQAREEDLKKLTLQIQNKLTEQTQDLEKTIEAQKRLLQEREDATETLAVIKEENRKAAALTKEKEAALAELESQVSELKADILCRDEEIRKLLEAQAPAEEQGLLEPVPEPLPQPGQTPPENMTAQIPATPQAQEVIENLKDELANARAAIHHRDVELSRLKNTSGPRPATSMNQADPEGHAEGEHPVSQTPMALQTAISGIRRETLKDSKKISEAAASYKRQRTAAKQEASSRKASKGGSSPSRKK
jgi:hypothetical protein